MAVESSPEAERQDQRPSPGVSALPALRNLYFPLLVLLTCIVAFRLAILTWGKWGDPVIDVGREVDVPWKITQGWVLYRDMPYIYGPLSPHLNAFLMLLFGIRLRSLLIGGFLSAGVGALLTYSICRGFIPKLAAVCMVNVFLLECVFQHYYWNGSFNYILPYSFPAVHAALLGSAGLLLLFRYLHSGARKPLVAAGVMVGLSLLCKIEIAAALAATLALGTLFLRRPALRVSRGPCIDTACWMLPAAVVAFLGYLPFFALSSPYQVLRDNVLRANLVNVRSSIFFLNLLGVSNLSSCLRMVLFSLFFWTAAVALLWAASRLVTLEGGHHRYRGPIAGALLAVATCVVSWYVPAGLEHLRALPLVCAGVAAVTAWRLFHVAEGCQSGIDKCICALAVFGLLTMGRMALNAGMYHYGFYMALPGLLLAAVFLIRLLPQWLGFRPGAVRAYVIFVTLFVLLQSVRNFTLDSLPMYRLKSVELATPRGYLMAHPRPRYLALRAAMDYLAQTAPPGSSLFVIPEGAVLNFLLGMPNPLAPSIVLPTEIAMPGVEANLVRQMKERKVDFVLLLDRQVVEYGFRAPGVDFAVDLMKYIRENYRVELTIGAPPFASPDTEGGAVLFRRVH